MRIFYARGTYFRAIFEHQATDKLTGRLSASHSDHDKIYANFYASGYDAANNTATLDGYVDTTKRSTSIVSYELNGELQTGGITHRITVGAEYLDTDNDNDRYHAHWLPDSMLILILNCSQLHDRLIFLAE